MGRSRRHLLMAGNVELCPARSGMCEGKLGIACVLGRRFTLNSKVMRYKVIGFRKRSYSVYNSRVVEEAAKTREEANILFDIMLEDKSMDGGVRIKDMASGLFVRNSLDVNDRPL